MASPTADAATASTSAVPAAPEAAADEFGASTASAQDRPNLEDESVPRVLAEPHYPAQYHHYHHHTYSYPSPTSTPARLYSPYPPRPSVSHHQRRASSSRAHGSHQYYEPAYYSPYDAPPPPWHAYAEADTASLPPLPPLPALPRKAPVSSSSRKPPQYFPHPLYGSPSVLLPPSEFGGVTGGGSMSPRGRAGNGARAGGIARGSGEGTMEPGESFGTAPPDIATVPLDIVFCKQTGQCRQASSPTFGVSDKLVHISFPAQGWSHVYELGHEIFPWTGNGNNWIKGQVSEIPCKCGFHFRMGNGVSYKRPAVIREHLSKCSTIAADDPLATFCRLTREQDRARSGTAKRLTAKAKRQADAEKGGYGQFAGEED